MTKFLFLLGLITGFSHTSFAQDSSPDVMIGEMTITINDSNNTTRYPTQQYPIFDYNEGAKYQSYLMLQDDSAKEKQWLGWGITIDKIESENVNLTLEVKNAELHMTQQLALTFKLGLSCQRIPTGLPKIESVTICASKQR
ncbi:hypothetical protein [Vibrio scophthalmi]|uniref:Lipoprotein n=1 Tax=Vibrio scophthalmi LMG 19158 TaxID=870967 RepID=F9RIE9_9VIBR|nr:hypothetical protein [Vibrio scophthalmi]EGU42481.1 hypothetical protein VIS19158_11808 [Vibrio scophthalmi LMG 19158]